MRVLHIITGLAAGGAEQQLRLLLRHRDYSAEVAALTNPGSIAEAIRAEGTVVHEVGMRGNADLSAMPRLIRLIHSGRFDVVHTHLFRAQVHGRVGARLAGIRHVVATEHSLGDRFIEGRLASRPVRALYLGAERLGDVTIAVSGTVARRLRAWGIPGSRVEVIPNAIELTDYRFDPGRRAAVRNRLGIPTDRFVIGFVGRLVRGKRADLVLRAVVGQPEVSVLAVGEGPQRPALTRLAGVLGVDATFTGESAEVPALMSAMDVVVSPSQEETFGLAVIEALASGLPVLYTSCPAIDDLEAGSAPAARRIAPDVHSLRAALADAVRVGPHRRPPPPALDHFDVPRLGPRVGAVYARLAGGRPYEHRTHASGGGNSWPAQPTS
jgi:glycosyltransferase involved in cell wall biosynthesis